MPQWSERTHEVDGFTIEHKREMGRRMPDHILSVQHGGHRYFARVSHNTFLGHANYVRTFLENAKQDFEKKEAGKTPEPSSP